jgi:hypothetical protein
MLYGKLLRSPHPHAHILSIDISKAAALANAVYDALGVRIDAISITPEKVLKALELRARGQEPRVGPKGIPAGSCPPLRKVERLEEWLQVVPDPGTKKMVRVYVARVLCQLADLPDTP